MVGFIIGSAGGSYLSTAARVNLAVRYAIWFAFARDDGLVALDVDRDDEASFRAKKVALIREGNPEWLDLSSVPQAGHISRLRLG